MTTAEAAFRLLRHSNVRDLAALEMSQASELMGALSAAVATFFRHGPAILRSTSASTHLPAPVAVSGLVVAANAFEVSSGTPFTTAQRGASILIDGDANRNEIVSTVGWLNPYQGTAGTKTATIYGDCVPISTRLIERLTSHPWILDGTNGADRKRQLARVDREAEALTPERDQTGFPQFYSIRPSGASRGASAQYLMRVWPMPARQLVIRFDCEVQPDLFDFTNVAQVVVDLPFSEVQMESVVLPLAEAELLSSTLHDEIRPEVAARIEGRAERAMETLRQLPRDHGKPAGRVRTKRGF